MVSIKNLARNFSVFLKPNASILYCLGSKQYTAITSSPSQAFAKEELSATRKSFLNQIRFFIYSISFLCSLGSTNYKSWSLWAFALNHVFATTHLADCLFTINTLLSVHLYAFSIQTQ